MLGLRISEPGLAGGGDAEWPVCPVLSEPFFSQLSFSKMSLGHYVWVGINISGAGTRILGFPRPAVGSQSQHSLRRSRVHRIRCSKMAASAVRMPIVFILLPRFLAAAAAIQQETSASPS